MAAVRPEDPSEAWLPASKDRLCASEARLPPLLQKLPANRTLCLWPVGPFHMDPSLNFGLSNMGPLALGSHLSVICTLLRG